MMLLADNVKRVLMDTCGLIRDCTVPPLCLTCDALLSEPGGCCPQCWARIRFISVPLCEVTGKPFSHDLGEGMLSAEAIANPPPYGRCRSAVVYTDMVRGMVTGLKYSDRTDLAPWMANWMITAGKVLLADNPIVIPVPLHPLRLLERRFNQSAELARNISYQCAMRYEPDWLIRSRRTKQQVGLNGEQRKRNVAGAFRVPTEKKPHVSGHRFLLVDDVYTSGATVNAAARALLRSGAVAVDVLTFARVEGLQD